MLTVPLLVIAGVPGVAANGSNRVGILASNIASIISFKREGVQTSVRLLVVLVPAVLGSVVGAFGISELTDQTFERIFGLLMLPLIALVVLKPERSNSASKDRTRWPDRSRWSMPTRVLVFFAIGVYAGAIQAGVGLLLIAALSHIGVDLISANLVKVIFSMCATLVALPVFILGGNVIWEPAIYLALGLSAGGWIGAKFAVKGGEKWIRVVIGIATLALAIRLISR